MFDDLLTSAATILPYLLPSDGHMDVSTSWRAKEEDLGGTTKSTRE